MSWTNELYNIYEKNCGRTDSPAILPLFHSTANAQIEVTLNENGEFVTANTVDKENTVTIIPVTEDSASRSSGITPHPFADKLIYIAGDYGMYFKGKKSDNTEYFSAFIEQLKAWKESSFSHPAVNAVFTYLEKGCIIKDLIACGVLETDENGLLKSGVKINTGTQEDAFVRFRINYDDISAESRTWKDNTLYQCYINYMEHFFKEQKPQLCYATGQVASATYKHPSRIRNAGDRGKLISANDENGFSYRGRFRNKEDALSVGVDFSQKMHNALKWLIKKQGIPIKNSLTLIVWESSLNQLPNITKSADEYDFDDDTEELADTYPAYKSLLSKMIFGYQKDLPNDSKAFVMGLDSATTGRVAMVMYSEFQTSALLKNIRNWHEQTAWIRFSSKKKTNIINSFSFAEIINSAFGTEQGKFIKAPDKVITDYVCKLVPCVCEGRKIPSEIVRALVMKASSPLKYENSYNHRLVLETACGMIRKQMIENKEECKMALDTKCSDKSYLYGRLLAVAHAAEKSTYEKGEDRNTNALRYFETFSNRPYATWDIIRKRIEPYLEKGKYGEHYRRLIDEITVMFNKEDFCDNTKLEPIYLLAYSCQLAEIYTSKANKEKSTDTEEE